MTELENNVNTNSNNGCANGPYIVIIILLVIIAILSFFIGKSYSVLTGQATPGTTTAVVTEPKDIVVKVIDDKKCSDCQTASILESIQQLPFLSWATIEKYDFSDSGVEEILKENGITKLPAFLLNTNQVPDTDFAKYLKATPAGLYTLEVNANHDPYAKRSENGFLLLPEGILKEIKDNSRIFGNKDSEILWVEYSDINCGYCAKLHNDGTHDALFEKFGDKLSVAYQYFAIFNREAPEILECIADQKGTDVMYQTIKKAYKDGLKDKAWIAWAVEWLNQDELTACIESGKYKAKIDEHMKVGTDVFGVTGTPGNILINTKTGEYAKLPGAYPVADFEKTINNLLGK